MLALVDIAFAQASNNGALALRASEFHNLTAGIHHLVESYHLLTDVSPES